MFSCALVFAAACNTVNAPRTTTRKFNFDSEAIKPTSAQNAAIRRAAIADINDFNHPENNAWRVVQADLNDDGQPDLVVQYADGAFCGSAGCSGAIVMATADGYAAKAIALPNFMGTMAILSMKRLGHTDQHRKR